MASIKQRLYKERKTALFNGMAVCALFCGFGGNSPAMVGIAGHIEVIGEVGGKNHIVAVEVFYNAVFFKRHYPATVLVHAVIDDENGVAAAKWGFY